MEAGVVGLLGPVVELTVEGQSPDLATIQLQLMGELTVWGQLNISILVLVIVVKVRYAGCPNKNVVAIAHCRMDVASCNALRGMRG